VVGAHIDSPRLELKGRPLYSSGEFALFQTNYHGGIKNYQWTNIPLALMGRVDKKDGTTVQISVGLKADDPIFMIPDLAPHTDRGYGAKKVNDQIKKEELDPLVGHIPAIKEDGTVKEAIFKYLSDTYGVSPADLVSAELALVPAFAPRDLGFDRGLIAAYGHDDKLASFAAMRAIANLKKPRKTAMAYLVDNEEVGNRNNTGAKSEYFSTLVARMLESKLGDDYRETVLKRTLRQSKMVSVDVNPGINPKKPSAWEKGNAPRLGFGVNIKLYGQGNTANSEYIAWTRRYLDQANIPWQTTTYKVGAAGGGTIGGEFSRQNMEVIDFGVPVLSIHTPISIGSKIDLYHLYRASQVFFKN
jgi:aspartyl aminopeptidase